MPASAATEPWLMIAPPPAATMPGAAAWEHRNVPLALTAKLRSQSSSVASITDPALFTPALLYNTSTRPYSLRICSKALVTCSRSATLATTGSAVPPEAAISPAVSLAASALRSTTATAAPSRANRTAAARPMPDPAPVTTAVLPASLPVIASRPFFRNENRPPCCLHSQGRHPAVQDQRVAGHVAEPPRGQQRDRVRDLGGRGHPPGRDPALHLRPQVRLVQPPAGHRGVDHARADGVGPDPGRRVVHRDRPGQHQRRALGRGVRAPARERDQPGDGRDRDDVPGAPFDHGREHRVAAQEWAAHVDRLDPVPFLDGGLVAPGR